MQITVVPASTRCGQAAVRSLLAKGDASVTVVGIYRDAAKAPSDLTPLPNFKAVQGNVEEPASLDFAGSDAVITITPPIHDGRDMVEHSKTVSENVKAASRKAGVKRLVYVSSAGAQYEKGTGGILTNHAAEKIYIGAAPEVVFVRCAYFMDNWALSLDTVLLDQPFFFSTITPLDYKVPMVATDDIGVVAADEALQVGTPLSGPKIFELQGPRSYTTLEVQAAFETVLGKKVEVKPVPKEGLRPFFGQVFPPNSAEYIAEMYECFLPGGVIAHDMAKLEAEGVRGRTELLDFTRKLVADAKKA